MVEKTEIADKFEANIRFLGRVRLRNLVLVTFLFLCFFALLSGVSAANFNSSSNQQDIQDFLSNTTSTDNEVVFEGGDYNQITGLTVGRSVNISSTGQVNIRSPNTGTLFTITSPNVKIVNLNISGYATAINSNKGNLSVIGCNISTIDRSFHLSGPSLTDVLLENNTIISSVSTTTYGAVYVTASAGSVVNITLRGNNITVNGTSDSMGVRFNVVRCNNTLLFENNNITGTSYHSIYLNAYTSNNTITITNNNITGTTGYGVSLHAYTNSNSNITITNNNITGTTGRGVYLNASTNSNNTITITNNNITGRITTNYSVYLNAYTSNNTITITNNNITCAFGLYLGVYNSNSNITVTNNNITGTSAHGLYLYAYTSNNTITVTNNNITGASASGVYLRAETSNNTISFTDNNIKGASYGMGVYCNNKEEFSGLSVVNNTLNVTNSAGIGIGFVNLTTTDLSDIFVSGNNIFAGTTDGTGINFVTGLSSVDNVTINYNRVLAATGLSIPTTTTGNVNANLNWWGVNAPVIVGMALDNWFVMELSANSFWSIVNASVNQSGLVDLTYKFLLFTNASNSTSVVDFANLPHFLVDIFWNDTNGNIYNVIGVDALGTYSYTVTPGSYTLNSIGDWSNVRLDITSAKLNTGSTIVVPGGVRVGKTITITGVATDVDGNPLANVDLTVTVDGKTYTVTTDSDGRWILAYKPTHTGNVDVSVSWAGNDTYFGFTNSTTFNVKKGNIIVTIKVTENDDGSVTIIGNANDEDGDPVSGYPVDFILDGKTVGQGITDSNGISSVTIPASKLSDGPHTITVRVGGSENFNDGIASIEFTKTSQNNETNNTNETTNYPATANAAAMKKTGIPIAILLILTVLGLTTYRRKI